MSSASTHSAHPEASRAALWTGWILSGILALLLVSGAVNALIGSAQVVQSMAKFGFPPSFLRISTTIEIVCTLLFLLPRTAALGAILLTAYMGGAVITHARIGDPTWIVPVVIGLLIWVALLLRMPRYHVIRPSRY